ncbi:hypothetical protein NQ318_013721 [Aromia moschata]|uniref:Uncharacterized protein n=1 Tax=Aromia moschata TaxID=1265417 RepID=A0AAV8ZAN3_9CUCU|nr:hypothetical protein NQ318_013721 [Aromia moschata]
MYPRFFESAESVSEDDCETEVSGVDTYMIGVDREGCETAEDDPRLGRPLTSKTDENIEKLGKSTREYRRLSIRRLAKITGIDKECVRQILHKSFNMRKNGAKTPHIRAKAIKHEHLC